MKNQTKRKETESIIKTKMSPGPAGFLGSPIKHLNGNRCQSFPSFDKTLKSKEEPHRPISMVPAGFNTILEGLHSGQAQATLNMEGWTAQGNPHTECTALSE